VDDIRYVTASGRRLPTSLHHLAHQRARHGPAARSADWLAGLRTPDVSFEPVLARAAIGSASNPARGARDLGLEHAKTVHAEFLHTTGDAQLFGITSSGKKNATSTKVLFTKTFTQWKPASSFCKGI
jgi:hypothetical protein